jgi:hypothetical protein
MHNSVSAPVVERLTVQLGWPISATPAGRTRSQLPAMRQRRDVEQLAALGIDLMVDLQGRVVQVELVVQHPLQAATRGV